MRRIRQNFTSRDGKRTFSRIIKATNAVECAAPTSVWGYKGCAGKGGRTQNATISTSDK